ncbi:hypothetical protein MMC06_002384 [Schaereria dolodes]|nr:hypothetical protein [Schaereria dolodes]
MASPAPTLRPLSCWKSIFRKSQHQRYISLGRLRYRTPPPPPSLLPSGASDTAIIKTPYRIKTYPPPPSTRSACPSPIASLTATQLTVLDPTSSRTRLFARSNKDAVKVGDILLVRFKSGEPYAGVCINIRRRGVDTGILLRNQLTRVGVEMWVKIYSPTVVGIEVVQRRVGKRRGRARWYYLRKPKHDRGSVQNIVDAYQRERRLIRGGAGSATGSSGIVAKGRGANAQKKKGK